jgi:DNA-binding beta-propeller fold protein YncE
LKVKILFAAGIVSLFFLVIISAKYSYYWTLKPVSVYDSGYDEGTEIISVQQNTLRAVLNNYKTGEVDVLDISHPELNRRINRLPLQLKKGEELTSVAFHPSLDLFAAVIDAGVFHGRLEIRSATTGQIIVSAKVGYGPDAVIFSEDGKMLLIANEGEDFWFDPANKEFFTPEGSVSLIRLDEMGRIIHNKTIALADMTNHEGFIISAGGRFLEREIDWNGNGEIDKKVDFNKDGIIEKKKVKLGYFHGREVFGTETKGEGHIMIPITDYSPALLEPEYIAISPDQTKAYVTLQEDDGVAVIDLIQEKAVNYIGLGEAHHLSDNKTDGWIAFDKSMYGLREPDGIAVSPDGRYFITADEGDTDADESTQGPVSGGRSVSVFDAKTGKLVGDTANQVDETAFINQVYPERRSQKKGSEPEMLVAFEIDQMPFVAVGLERAGAVELISLKNPSKPSVIALGKILGEENKSPEGIAHFILNNNHYLLTANEMDGSVECFQIRKVFKFADYFDRLVSLTKRK